MVSESLIGPDQDFAIWSILIAIAAFGFWCERTSWGQKYSGVMLLITLSIILANLRVIPTSAGAYDVVWQYLVPIAIPLLLFEANLRRIIKESGPTLLAFLIGSAAVVAGTIIGTTLIDLGPQEAEIAGIFTGTYIGGSLNFATVAEATNMQDSSQLAAAIAADNVITNLHFLLIILIPGISWMAKRYPTQHMENAKPVDLEPDAPVHTLEALDIVGLLMSLALAFAIAATGIFLASVFNYPQFEILLITGITVTIATILPNSIRLLSGHREAGNIMMFIFLASISASADVWQLIEIAPILFVFAGIIIIVHLIVLFGLGLLFRFDLAELAMASAVGIGGPSSAPALASAKGWSNLLIPGILAGSFGYAIGSFVGVTVAGWLS